MLFILKFFKLSNIKFYIHLLTFLNKFKLNVRCINSIDLNFLQNFFFTICRSVTFIISRLFELQKINTIYHLSSSDDQ